MSVASVDKTELITCGDQSLIRGNVRVDLEFIGEGSCGDYCPEDPRDEPLLRFSVYGRRRTDFSRRGLPNDDGLEWGEHGEWTPFSDASYCTNLPATLPKATQRKALGYLMDEVFGPARQGNSIKKLCERLSRISPEWLTTEAS